MEATLNVPMWREEAIFKSGRHAILIVEYPMNYGGKFYIIYMFLRSRINMKTSSS